MTLTLTDLFCGAGGSSTGATGSRRRRCGFVGSELMDDPRTVAEQLDAAKTGEEFGGVLMGFMAAMDKARWAEEEADDE